MLLASCICGGNKEEQSSTAEERHEGTLLTGESGRFTVIWFSYLFLFLMGEKGKSNWMMVLTFYSTLNKGGLRSYISSNENFILFKLWMNCFRFTVLILNLRFLGEFLEMPCWKSRFFHVTELELLSRAQLLSRALIK